MSRTTRKDASTRRDEANLIHNHKYNYDTWVDPISRKSRLDILCPSHGMFNQQLSTHLLGHGCPLCADNSRIQNSKKSKDTFVVLAKAVHGDKYDYSQLPDFPGTGDKVTIVCPTHGAFTQTLNTHIHSGSSCQQCAIQKSHYAHISADCITSVNDKQWLIAQNSTKSIIQISNELGVGDSYVGRQFHKFNIPIQLHQSSSQEAEISDYIRVIQPNTTILTNVRDVIPPKELDIYLPEHQIAIEFCGIYWHSEQMGKDKWYHFNKHKQCKAMGIRLITIFEDEWMHNKQIIKGKLDHVLSVSTDKLFARRTTVAPVSTTDKRNFFDNYHIQGNGPSSVNYGLWYNNVLVACIGFIKTKQNTYYLNRYATNIRVVGGFSKLLTRFTSDHPDFASVVTFADLRWSDGNLYEKNGFVLDCSLDPDYSYAYRGTTKRIHKFNFRRRFLPRRLKSFDVSLSERENCNNNNILRVWDCGKNRYRLDGALCVS